MVHICAPLAPLVRCKNSPKGPLTLCHIKFCLDYLMQHWTKARIKAIQFSLQHGLLCYMYGGLLCFHGRELAFLKQWNYYYAFDTMDRRNDSVPHKNIFREKNYFFHGKGPFLDVVIHSLFLLPRKMVCRAVFFLHGKKVTALTCKVFSSQIIMTQNSSKRSLFTTSSVRKDVIAVGSLFSVKPFEVTIDVRWNSKK